MSKEIIITVQLGGGHCEKLIVALLHLGLLVTNRSCHGSHSK